MYEFTTVDNITKAFQLKLGMDYSIYFDVNRNLFTIGTLYNNLISFEYDLDTMTFSYFKTDSFFCGSVMDKFTDLFSTFTHLDTCQKITDTFFNHDISKIIFRDPVVHDIKNMNGSKSMGRIITLSPKFTFPNSWNMIFIKQSYIITEDFNIAPVIDLLFNLRGFAKTRFFVDENTGTFVNILQETNFTLNEDAVFLNNLTQQSIEKNKGIIKTTTIGPNPHSNMIDCINDFMSILSVQMYIFYINKFKTEELASECSGTADEFKVLEMWQL